jgi:hypothetical protein
MTRFERRRMILMRRVVPCGIAVLAVVAACLGTEDDERFSTTSQAINPTPFAVMPNADTPAKYATACGLGTDAAATQLPDLGTATTPIRGTTRAADVGTLASNGWKLIQDFANSPLCLASASGLKANLWYKRAGGRDWYYLYRFADPDPTKAQTTLNGVLGFDDTSICAFDRLGPAALPPASINDLYYAGQTEDTAKMDDCSDCHVHGYNAPRDKTFEVAKGPSKKFPWMPARWITPWKAYAAAFGPEWKLGKAPTAMGYKWVSGQGAALVATSASCKSCHGNNWIKPRSTANYCGSVFQTACDANGSMINQGNKFGTNAECTAFVGALGCNAMAVCATAVAAAPPPPMVNESTLVVGQVQVINSTTVRITPVQNPGNLWVSGPASAIGDHWVSSLQVWGAPSSGGPTSTFPMTSPVSIPDPELLSDIFVTGLSPGTQYIFQLQTVDTDTSTAFSPTVTVFMPPGPGPGSDAGVGFDAGSGSGSDSGIVLDAGAGSGSDSGIVLDAGAGSGSDSGIVLDAGAGSGSGSGISLDAR